MKSVCLAVAAVQLAALAPALAGSPSDVATLRLKSIGGGLFNPNSNVFYAYDNERCTGDETKAKLTGLGFALGLGKGGVKPVTFPAGQRLFLRAVSSTAGVVDTNFTELQSCVNVVSFVPDAGHTYEVNQDAHGRQCTTYVIDAVTGAAPSTFQIHPLHWSCKAE